MVISSPNEGLFRLRPRCLPQGQLCVVPHHIAFLLLTINRDMHPHIYKTKLLLNKLFFI